MLAQADWGAILAIVLPVCVSIIGGGFAMAWRLGGLETRVTNISDDVHELKSDVKDLSTTVESLEDAVRHS